MDFQVWAPKATTVEIAPDNTRIPMTPCASTAASRCPTPAIVACNLATRAQCVPIGREQSSEVLLSSDPMLEVNASGATLPPDSVVVLGPAEL